MNLKSDIKIAQDAKELPITEIAKKLIFNQMKLNFMVMIRLRLAGRELTELNKVKSLVS